MIVFNIFNALYYNYLLKFKVSDYYNSIMSEPTCRPVVNNGLCEVNKIL